MVSKITALVALFLPLLCGSVQGQFLNLPQYDNGVKLSAFRQGDVNHDGKTDIVGIRSPESNSFSVTVLLGNGTGGFEAPLNTPISGIDNVELGQFLLRDFNGDGKLDVAVFGKDHVTGVNVVAVMLGNGDGTFQAPRETPSGSLFTPNEPEMVTIAAADFNGDGKLDIAYLGGGISVMLGHGDGSFSPPVTSSTAPDGGSIAVADFNNDKKIDLAIAGEGGGGVFLQLGNGNGTFQPPKLVDSNGSWPLVAADLNGDGNLDLVSGGGLGITVTVLLGDGTGHFPTAHYYQGPWTQATFAVQDLNGDGHLDIALLGNLNSPSFLTILLNNGDGSFTLGKTYNGDGTPPGAGLLAADLNGDDKTDLAFGNAAGGVSVLIGNGNGTFKGNFALNLGTNGGAGDLRAGELNGDLKPDLIPVPFQGQALLGNGDGTFTVTSGGNCHGLSTVAVGDFNNDGKLDLAGNTVNTNNVPAIDFCLGNGNGTFTAGGQFDQGIQHDLVLPGDFNNDGKLDLAASDQNGVSVLLGNGEGSFASGIPTAVGAPFPNFAVGDFNNDGKLDIVTTTSSGVVVLLGKGNGTFGPPIVSPGPTSGFLTVTDLNKDGKKDLVVANGGAVTVLLGKGDGAFQAPVHYAVAALTRAVINDFNGDGNLDVAVGAQGRTIDVFLGDGHGKLLTPPSTVRVGGQVTGIAESDFNGDKKPDLAVAMKNGLVVTLLHQ